MRLTTRIHEWLADRCRWVQYPRIGPAASRNPRASLAWRWSVMTWRERGWVLFWCYVGGAVLLSIYGNLVP